jgi:hypothetical protein
LSNLNSPLPCNVAYLQVLGITAWTFWRAVIFLPAQCVYTLLTSQHHIGYGKLTHFLPVMNFGLW